MRTYYIVVVTHHTYYCEINETPGYKEPAGIFVTLKEAEDFIKSAPDYDSKDDAELYYKIYPVELNVYPHENDGD